VADLADYSIDQARALVACEAKRKALANVIDEAAK
jgi:hypothetical protein